MKQYHVWLVLIVWLALTATGCSRGKDFDPPQPGEIPEGPGVFTKGDDGVVLYDSEGGGLIQPRDQKVSPSAGENTAPAEPTADDFKAYEAYRQWKAWKEDPQNKEEFQEFQDWLEWKRYQQWKSTQPTRP